VSQDPETSHSVAAVFHDVDRFEAALSALSEAGFAREAVSVLSSRGTLVERYGDTVPAPEALEDDPTSPREPLARQNPWRDFAHAVAEGLGIVSLYAVAGASIFVGGPIGVAAVSGDTAERAVDAALAGWVDDAWRAHFREAVEAGGVVCWVHADSKVEVRAAERVLREAGGEHVHVLAEADDGDASD